MIRLNIQKSSNKLVIGALTTLALYAPIKDVMHYMSTLFSKQTIEIVDASFGARTSWQNTSASYVKVANTSNPTFTKPQVIYTRLRLKNPTSSSQTYRKIWLNFENKEGAREYSTDYTLYNVETRQRLVGESVQVGPNSSIDVIAAYQFIPSYGHTSPELMSVSWEGQDLMREKACQYDLKTAMQNNFHYQCKS